MNKKDLFIKKAKSLKSSVEPFLTDLDKIQAFACPETNAQCVWAWSQDALWFAERATDKWDKRTMEVKNAERAFQHAFEYSR